MVENVGFFHRNFVFQASAKRKRGAKCRWKKYPKISLKIREKLALGELSTIFSKNRLTLQQIGNISVNFVEFSSIISKNCLPPPTANPTTPSFPMLI